MSAAPKFRRIRPGVYGTGIYRTTRDDCPYGFAPDAQVELVISKIESMTTCWTYWYIEEMLPNGELTLWEDDCPSPTLRAAKELITKRVRFYSAEVAS